jgi:hypothetical protein
MFSDIKFIFIVLLLGIILVCSKAVKERFFDYPVDEHNEYIKSSQKKYNTLTTMINPLNPAIDLNPMSSNSIKQAVNPLSTIPNSSLYGLMQEDIHIVPEDIPRTLKLAKSCETSSATCDAFKDPTFAANCGVSFDINGLGTDGKPHIGGLYLSPDDRDTQINKAQLVIDTGIPPHDPYKVYQPTLGKSKPGTFGITKDTCIIVKEKVDCEAKQTFKSPNCTQCYTTQDFSRVGPETGRNPFKLVITGNGTITISGSVKLDLVTLDPNSAKEIQIPGKSEGTTFTINAKNGSPTYISGYIHGEAPHAPFKLDIINLIQSDLVTNSRPRISGTKKVNNFRCVSIIPGNGKKEIKLSCMIPFSFLNMYDSDALTCDNGPVITKVESATFLESNPCYGKENKPGNYKLECLQMRWMNMGGTPEGTGFPSTKEKADAIQRGSGGENLDIDTIIDNLSVIMSKALTGMDEKGIPLSIPDWNAASMYATGVPINTPCDGPGGQQPLSQRCASYLYTNQGATSRIGPTYSLPASMYASQKEAFETYNYPLAPADPKTSGGLGGSKKAENINELKNAYDYINRTANDNSLKNDQRSAAINSAFGANVLPNEASKTPGPTQVFAVGPGYIYNQDEAAGVCARYGAQVATTAQLDDAQKKGADWCFSGWVAEGTCKWPITTSIIGGCGGRAGLIEWIPWYNKAGVNCYGPKPHIEDVPANSILPFNGSSWDDPTQSKSGIMLGRYIHLQYNHGECLNLTGIEVYSSENGGNIITPQMGVSKSSTFGPDYFPNQNFIDGNNNTFVHTSCGDVPWIRVDLGTVKPIYKIVIINRYDCCQSRILGTSLYILDGNGAQTYKSEAIVSVNQKYTWFPPSTTVYGDIPSTAQKLNNETPWKCLPGIPVPLRKNVMGDVECMSFNYRDCLWQGSDGACQALNNNKPASLAPLACGEMHNRNYGGSGYDSPGHWCANAKDRV